MIHYGIHTDANGVRWVYQGPVNTNFVGLKTEPPIEIPKGNGLCPHNIPFSKLPIRKSHWHRFTTMMHKDELAALHLPVVKQAGEPVYWVNYQEGIETHLSLLSRICSPIQRVIFPAWTLTPTRFVKEMQATNIQPLVISNIKPTDRRMLTTLVEQAQFSPRRLILVAGPEGPIVPVPGTQTVDTDVTFDEELISYPFEALGATFLRAYCQGRSVEKVLDVKEPAKI